MEGEAARSKTCLHAASSLALKSSSVSSTSKNTASYLRGRTHAGLVDIYRKSALILSYSFQTSSPRLLTNVMSRSDAVSQEE